MVCVLVYQLAPMFRKTQVLKSGMIVRGGSSTSNLLEPSRTTSPAAKRAKHGTFADCRLLRLGVSICGSNDMANACVQGAMGYVCVCMNTCSKTFPRTAVQSPHLFPCRTTSPQKQHRQER